MIVLEHGKLDQIVQKAIKNQLIRQNRSFDWDSSKKNLDIRKLKWSRSVDSPTLDETGNSTSVLDRSNHQEGKTISQPDDRFSLISNKTKQDKNNKEGKEAATQVGWLTTYSPFIQYGYGRLKLYIISIIINYDS